MPVVRTLPRSRLCLAACAMLLCLPVPAQKAPVRPDRPWDPPALNPPDQLQPRDVRLRPIDPAHPYTLPELIDLAEEQNPQTRVAWQQARTRAAELGIARSELYPALAAVAVANTTRDGVLFGATFVRQTMGIFEPLLRVNYTIFDYGQRSDRIAVARDQLAGANFAFNSVHLQILFDTSRLYYRLLNAQGQREAQELNLKNAETVRQAVDARLANGLATLPDALEARAARAQAEFDLQAALGEVEIARGDLLTILGDRPSGPLTVESLDALPVPDHVDDSAEAAIERSLAQRPELGARLAERSAAQAGIRQARAAYIPTLDFQGDGGEVRAYGQQDLLPGLYAGPLESWNVSLNLRWTVFDGGRREEDLIRSHADERRAEAEIDATRDEVEQQVWTAWVDLETALRQRRAAQTLLEASRVSYDAALKTYNLGLRNIVDVVSAQRTLALALSEDVAARTTVLTQFATLAYRTGDLVRPAARGRNP